MSEQQVGGTHYQGLGIEPLEVMKSWLGEDGYNAYLLGNVIKYIARYPKKGGYEDLRKAQHYLRLRVGDQVGEKEPAQMGIGPYEVSKAWLGRDAYEAHLRADVIEYLGHYAEEQDFSWLAATLERLDMLVEYLS